MTKFYAIARSYNIRLQYGSVWCRYQSENVENTRHVSSATTFWCLAHTDSHKRAVFTLVWPHSASALYSDLMSVLIQLRHERHNILLIV